MWLRNWDNIQLIRLCGQIEQINTTEFGDNSRCLKDINGNIFTGNQVDFFGGFQQASVYWLYNGGLLNSSCTCGLMAEETWSKAKNLQEFASSPLRQVVANNTAGETNPTIEVIDDNIRYSSWSLSGVGMFIGTGAIEGNTVCSYDDYNLISEATMLIGGTYSKVSAAKDTNKKVWNIPVSRTFTNPTKNSVTIKEIGIFIMIGHATSGIYNGESLVPKDHNAVPVMVYHEILAEPVTLEPGEYQTFTIKIQLPTHDI